MDPKADQSGHPCLDEENAKYEILTPDVPTGSGPSPVGRYPRALDAPPTAVCSSPGPTGPSTTSPSSRSRPPEFGVYIYDPATKKNQLIYNDRGTWSLNALAVTPRSEPPVIGDLVSKNQDNSAPVRIGSVDVTKTSLKETVKGGKYGDTGVGLDVALHDAREGPRHRGLLERRREGRHDVRPHDGRRRRHPRRSPRLRGRQLARGDPRVSPGPPSSRSTSTAWPSATSASGSRACLVRIAAASAATSSAPASARRAHRSEPDRRRAGAGAGVLQDAHRRPASRCPGPST